MGQQKAARSAREHALAVLRARNTLLATALLPAAALAVLLGGGSTGHLPAGWSAAHTVLLVTAVLAVALATAVAVVIARARPAVTPTVEIPERAAPALHALIRDLADRLDVPAPGALALTPDCDSWLEEPAARRRPGGRAPAPVLVIGSPFLWWMRVAELRALLAPVVAGTGPSRHPDIAAARRCLRALDACAATAAGRLTSRRAVLRHPLTALSGRLARLILRMAGDHAAEMERGVAAAAAARARTVDHGLRIVAQEQVGLAYAGWDRLLTRVALPAWRLGRWPDRLNAGVVSSLTDLSQRDRLAEGFAARLGERPACDLLEEPGEVDGEVSLLAARLFHGPPAGRPWHPVAWSDYPAQVGERLWRERADRLYAALGAAPGTAVGSGAAEGSGAAGSSGAADRPGVAQPSDTARRSDAAQLADTAPRPGAARPGTPAPGSADGPATGPSGPSGALAGGFRPPAAAAPSGAPAVTGHAGPSAVPGSPVAGRPGSPASGRPGTATGGPDGAAPGGPASGPVRPVAEASGPGPGPRAADGASTADRTADGTADRTADDRYAGRPDHSDHTDHGHPSPGPSRSGGPLTPGAAERPAGDAARGSADGGPRDPFGPSGPPASRAEPPRALGDLLRRLAEDGREFADALGARLTAAVAREERPHPPAVSAAPVAFPLQPPPTGGELLAQHLAAAVCCATVDGTAAAAGLDWLDGPVLTVDGIRVPDLSESVHALVDAGDPRPLRAWLREAGVRPDTLVRQA